MKEATKWFLLLVASGIVTALIVTRIEHAADSAEAIETRLEIAKLKTMLENISQTRNKSFLLV